MKRLGLLALILLILCGCAETPGAATEPGGDLELHYAEQFTVSYLENGCSLITITESGRFLLVPEGAEPPRVDSDVTVLRQPLENIYLAATSAMCLFDALDALPAISASGTKAEGWYIENARAAMERGEIIYAGKYSAPDYELLLSQNCGLAIESTMISHAPEVKEKLEALGIPVLVERSSYETHPLGRTEWIKLYGLLTGNLEFAERVFEEQLGYLDAVASGSTGKTVAFFYISSAGSPVVRKSSDYAMKMIELAGGENAFGEVSSGSLEAEHFYAYGKDADIIIYNSSIDGVVNSVDELIAKSHMLEDFKAVQSGDVWCVSKNLFQETTEFGQMISEMNQIFTGEAVGELVFYNKLR